MQIAKFILKVINIKYVKFFDNIIYLIILKTNNVIYIYVEKKFIDILARNIVQFVQPKKENMGIVKNYLLNILIIIIYL